MTLSIPLRQMRPYPALLVKLGVAPVMADFTPANSAAFATAITNSTGGDTITLTAGTTYTGPFTLKSGLTSTVTIRFSGGAAPGPGRHSGINSFVRCMKRKDLIRHLEAHGCELLREGGSHTIYINRLREPLPQFHDIVK